VGLPSIATRRSTAAGVRRALEGNMVAEASVADLTYPALGVAKIYRSFSRAGLYSVQTAQTR
jgi:hypothetical protein